MEWSKKEVEGLNFLKCNATIFQNLEAVRSFARSFVVVVVVAVVVIVVVGVVNVVIVVVFILVVTVLVVANVMLLSSLL